MTDKETAWERRWREAQEANKKEEEERAKFKEEWLKEEDEEKDEKWIHLTEEQKADLRTEIKETEEDDFRERKRALLEKLERQVEESGKSDVELKEIAELKNQLKDWNAILENKKWEEILFTYFKVVFAMTKNMAKKTVVTITEKDGTMLFSYEFFDKDNKEIVTEFNDGVKE